MNFHFAQTWFFFNLLVHFILAHMHHSTHGHANGKLLHQRIHLQLLNPLTPIPELLVATQVYSVLFTLPYLRNTQNFSNRVQIRV